MHIVVVGAAGRIGRQVVAQALDRGHRVTGVVRRPEQASAVPGAQIVIADVLGPQPWPASVTGADAVVFAVGSRGNGPTVVRSEGIAGLLDAFPSGGSPRVVVLSDTGVQISPNVSILRRLAVRFLVSKLLHNAFNDMERMEEELRHHNVDWTVVRCTKVRETSGRPADAGVVRVSIAGQESVHSTVATRDLARFLVTDAIDGSLSGAAVALAGTR